jgi:hypothetical protein
MGAFSHISRPAVFLLVCIVSFCLSSPLRVSAQEGGPGDLPAMKSQAGSCAVLKDYVLRLQCFDRLAEDMGISHTEKVEKELAKYGLWRAIETITPDGVHSTDMRLPANSPTTGANGEEHTPDLVLTCKTKHTDAYIDWKAHVAYGPDTKTVDLVYLFDSDVGITTSWDVSLDRNALYIPRPVDFIRSMHGKKTLTVQSAQTQYDDMFTLVFTLNGLEDVLKMMAQRCYS